MIEGYYIKRNFFSNEPEEAEVRFYLTDGGATASHTPVMRITDVIISVDFDNAKAVINVPQAFGTFFCREINLCSEREVNDFRRFLEDVSEWLGYKEQWRKVGRDWKTFHLVTIENGKANVEIRKGVAQD